MLETYIFPPLFLCLALTIASYKTEFTFTSGIYVFFATIAYIVGIGYTSFGEKEYLPEIAWLVVVMLFVFVKCRYSPIKYVVAMALLIGMQYSYDTYLSGYLTDFTNWFDRAVTEGEY